LITLKHTRKMKYTTTIEIEELETEICIQFDMTNGDVDVVKIVDVHSGEELSEDLMTHELYNDCAEFYSDQMSERRKPKRVNVHAI